MHAKVMIPNKILLKELGKEGPVLVLLGDVHTGNEKCDFICQPKGGCYSLYTPSTFLKFVDKLAKKHSISVDFFLEIWLSESVRRAMSHGVLHNQDPGSHNSAIMESILEAAACTSHMSDRCHFPHVRTHLSDPRRVDLLSKYNAEWLMFNIFNELSMYSVDKYRAKLEEIYPGFQSSYLLSLISRMCRSEYTMHDFFSEPFFQKYSRVYHEWVQLPRQVREVILNKSEKERHIKFKRKDESREFGEYKILFDKLIIENLYDFNPILKPRSQSAIYVLLVDIYTIARALKRFRHGLDSELSIIYLGNDHIKNIQAILAGYYRVLETYGEDVKYPLHKCIQKNKLPGAKKKVCSNNRARRGEVTKKEAQEISRKYLISDKGEKVDLCKRLIKLGLVIQSPS